jgi:hypothetical protein
MHAVLNKNVSVTKRHYGYILQVTVVGGSASCPAQQMHKMKALGSPTVSVKLLTTYKKWVPLPVAQVTDLTVQTQA